MQQVPQIKMAKNIFKKGFSLLELVLTIAIFAIVSVTISYLIIDATNTTAVNNKKIHATVIAKEGIEAIRSILDADGFGGLSIGSGKGLSFNDISKTWSLVSSPDEVDYGSGVYIRSVDVADVTDSDESKSGKIKEVAVTVTSTAGVRNISVSLVSQFTDWR